MVILDNPDPSAIEPLQRQVLAVRPADWPDTDRKAKPFGIFDTDDEQSLRAGVLVYVHPGWAYIDLLWVAEDLRGQGLGQLYMQKAEEEAVRRKCHSAFLWTQDYEAPGFYEKLGYKRFVTFEDFIPGHQRIGFMKRLAA